MNLNKNNHYTTIIISFLFIILLLYSCQDDNFSAENKLIITNVTQDIDTETYWKSSNLYIINKSDFKINRALIIQAGTIIKFNPDSGRSITVTENGQLLAQGSIANPIYFTSYNDDTNGGDSNSDGNSTSPKQGDWNYIILNGKQASLFNNCIFLYGGGNVQNPSTIIVSQNCSTTISKCVFSYNNGGSFDSGNGVINASNCLPTTKVYKNYFYNNNLPLVVNPNLNIDSTNYFINPNNSNQKNKYNVIIVNSELNINSQVHWFEYKVAIVIRGNALTVESNASILFGNNVVLKFPKNGELILEGGNSTLINNDGYGVAFTSVFDDSRKGDSNGDGTNTTPSKNDWKGIKTNDPADFNWTNVFFANTTSN